MKKFVSILALCCLTLTACGNKTETANPEATEVPNEDVIDLASSAYDYFSDIEDLEKIVEELPDKPWSFLLDSTEASGTDVLLAIKMVGKSADCAVLICNDGATCYNYCGLLDVSQDNKCTLDSLSGASLSGELSTAEYNDALSSTSDMSVMGEGYRYSVSSVTDSEGNIIGILYKLQ